MKIKWLLLIVGIFCNINLLNGLDSLASASFDVSEDFNLLDLIKPERRWYNPISWIFHKREPPKEKRLGVRDTIHELGQVAQTLREQTLPSAKNVFDAIPTKYDQTLQELIKLHEDGLSETKKLRELIERIPLRALGAATSYLGARYLTIPGIIKLLQVYSRIKPRPELFNLGLLQTSSGLAVSLLGLIMLLHKSKT